MLNGLAAILTTSALLISCKNQEITYSQFSKEENLPLVEGSEMPEMHLRVDLLAPAGTTVLENVIKDSIISWTLGKSYTGMGIDSSISRFSADCRKAYRETNLDLYRELSAKDSSYSERGTFNHERIIESSILYEDDNYLSIIANDYSYQGGAHGSTYILYRTLNKKNNKTITTSDIFRSEEGLDRLIKTAIAKSAGLADPDLLDRDGTYFAESIRTSENFILAENGIRWMYNQYEIRPYAYGTTEVFLSYDELSTLLKDDFSKTLL